MLKDVQRCGAKRREIKTSYSQRCACGCTDRQIASNAKIAKESKLKEKIDGNFGIEDFRIEEGWMEVAEIAVQFGLFGNGGDFGNCVRSL